MSQTRPIDEHSMHTRTCGELRFELAYPRLKRLYLLRAFARRRFFVHRRCLPARGVMRRLTLF